MRHKWLLLTCVGVILVHASLASQEYGEYAAEGSAVETAELSPSSTQSPRHHSDEENTETKDWPYKDKQIEDERTKEEFTESGLTEPTITVAKHTHTYIGFDNTEQTNKFSNYDASSFARSDRGYKYALTRPTTTKRPSSICTIATNNYDCILQDVQLNRNEDTFFGLDWKNNPQINVTFTKSRLAYLPKSLFTAFPQMELLNAEDLQIEEIENQAFKNAANLKVLYLQNNLISYVNSFKGVPLLTLLNLAQNRIEEIKPDAFQNNKKLKMLLMNNNQISVLPSFQNIENLEMLNLSSNALHKIENNQFSLNMKLQYLDLSFNQLNNFHLDQLDDTTALSFVDVSYNALESLYIPQHVRKLVAQNNSIQEIITNFCAVEKLDLSHNQITDISSLHKCERMKTLDLSFNKLQSFNLNEHFPILNVLNLAHNQLFEIDLTTKFPHPLQILDLSDNFLSYSPANKLTNLKVVKLNNNKLIDFKFNNLPSLTYMLFSNNEWNCVKIEEILQYKKDIVGDANETCTKPNTRTHNGICCRDYSRAFNDRLNEILREINVHENVNKKDSEKCKQTRPTKGTITLDIQTIHDKTAKLDTATKQLLQQIENEKSKVENVSREIENDKTKQMRLQIENNKYKQIIEKLREHYGIVKEGLIGSFLTLNRTVQYTQERNSLSIDLLTRRTKEKADTNDRLEGLQTNKNALDAENENIKALLADLKRKETALKKERQKLEKDANKNSPSLQGSG